MTWMMNRNRLDAAEVVPDRPRVVRARSCARRTRHAASMGSRSRSQSDARSVKRSDHGHVASLRAEDDDVVAALHDLVLAQGTRRRAGDVLAVEVVHAVVARAVDLLQVGPVLDRAVEVRADRGERAQLAVGRQDQDAGSEPNLKTMPWFGFRSASFAATTLLGSSSLRGGDAEVLDDRVRAPCRPTRARPTPSKSVEERATAEVASRLVGHEILHENERLLGRRGAGTAPCSGDPRHADSGVPGTRCGGWRTKRVTVEAVATACGHPWPEPRWPGRRGFPTTRA